MSQLKLVNLNDFKLKKEKNSTVKKKKKNKSREKGKGFIRPKPIWKKFYSVYQFDFILYHKICADVVDKAPFNSLALKLPFKLFILYLIYFVLCSKFTRYDEPKFRKLCFVLDDDLKKVPRGDGKHIYRVRSLQQIHTKLFDYAHFSPFATESLVKRLNKTPREFWALEDTGIICRIKDLNEKGYTVHFDEEFGNQLEIKGTEMLSLKDRLNAHISLLKRLKRGESL